jgi:hypothetical protein
VPDKILAAARGESVLSDGEEDDDEPEVIRPTKRKPRYKEMSTDEEEEEEEGKSEEEEDDEDEDEDDDGEPIQRYSESEMGQKGEPFNDADLYMAAKHAAKYSEWVEMASKDRWDPFADRVGVLIPMTLRIIIQFASSSHSDQLNLGQNITGETRMVRHHNLALLYFLSLN